MAPDVTREERLRILGQDVIDMIAAEVAEEPPLSPMDVEILRRIFAGASKRVDNPPIRQQVKDQRMKREPRRAPAGFMWIEDAAEALGVEKSTLYTWRHKRRGPASFKHAGRVVYRASAIAEYLEACEAADARSNPVLSPLNRSPRPRVRKAG